MRVTVVALIAAFFFVFFADRIVMTIPAGHMGVLWERFGGTNVTRLYGEGTRFILPWNRLTVYDLRFQSVDQHFPAVDAQGLQLDLQVTVRFRLNATTLGQLHKDIGPDYLNVIVLPEVGSHARTVTSMYSAEEVYATRRSIVEATIRERVRNELSIKGRGVNPDFDFVVVEDILLRGITLPPLVALAIDEKMRQYHMEQEWVFRVQRERLEANRKEIEGEGIRRFQEKVGQGLTDHYLRWRGIAATEKIAESANAKVVIIGSGPQGLPIILGNDTAAPAPARPAGTPRSEAPVPAPPDVSSQPESATISKSPVTPLPGGAAVAAKQAPAPAAPPAAAAPTGIRAFLGRVLGFDL
jgi:regulator of protease activity HflC (stomatin/prohibitin superfamily)